MPWREEHSLDTKLSIIKAVREQHAKDGAISQSSVAARTGLDSGHIRRHMPNLSDALHILAGLEISRPSSSPSPHGLRTSRRWPRPRPGKRRVSSRMASSPSTTRTVCSAVSWRRIGAVPSRSLQREMLGGAAAANAVFFVA